MAETELRANDPQNGPEPFEKRSVQICAPLSPLGGNGGGPEQYAQYKNSTGPGSPLPLRPERAAANDRRYAARSRSVTAKGQIEPPCG